MITAARLPELSAAGIRSVTALTHPQMFQLVQRKVIEPGLFDERKIAEVHDPEAPGIRYLLCRNPLTAEKESRTRAELIGQTRAALEKLARSRNRRTPEEFGSAAGKALARWKVGKFFCWRVRDGKLEWELDQPRIDLEQALDGCYVIRTDVSEQVFDKEEAVAAYRQLAVVDRGPCLSMPVGLLRSMAHAATVGAVVRGGRRGEGASLDVRGGVGAAEGHPRRDGDLQQYRGCAQDHARRGAAAPPRLARRPSLTPPLAWFTEL